MQIRKIISGAQTGADRAALDFAVAYGIEHGGWVPRGRKAEDGIVPACYNVMELSDGGYPERTERNVSDSDGTLIVSHGELTGGSVLTLEMTQKHEKPCLYIDLNQLIIFDAAIDAHEWIAAYRIEVLNVAGPRASKDPAIYKAVYNILETVFHIGMIADAIPGIVHKAPFAEGGPIPAVTPRTVVEAVDQLMKRLSALEKMRIASERRDDLPLSGKSWGEKVRRLFGLCTGNDQLLQDCRTIAGSVDMDADLASMVILREFWKKLRASGHPRVVK